MCTCVVDVVDWLRPESDAAMIAAQAMTSIAPTRLSLFFLLNVLSTNACCYTRHPLCRPPCFVNKHVTYRYDLCALWKHSDILHGDEYNKHASCIICAQLELRAARARREARV